MTNGFLQQVVGHLKNEKLEQLVLVFPNRRSSVFFKRYLGEAGDAPFLSPKIFTISELFDALSEYETADSVTLLYELWKAYSVKDSEEGLDDFFHWGDMLLSDFADVDQSLADARQLFTNLKDINQLQSDFSWMSRQQIDAAERLTGIKNFWHRLTASGEGGQEVKQKFMEMWNNLYDVYVGFRNNLAGKGLCYPAMQYRWVAEQILSPQQNSVQERLAAYRKVAFIGFSAPTNCEKVLMRYFKNRKQEDGSSSGMFFWDFASEMLKDPKNRASNLISRCVEEFKPEFEVQIPDTPCQFDLYGVAGGYQQTAVAGRILEEIAGQEGFDVARDSIKTALVVSDESLLFPMLYQIPPIFSSHLNVTMGYPLRATQAAFFIDQLKRLHTSLRMIGGEVALQANVLLAVLDHPYIKILPGSIELRKELIKNNNFHIMVSELQKSEPLEVKEPLLGKFLNLLAPGGVMVESLSNDYAGEGLIRSITEYQICVLSFVAENIESIERGYIYKYIDILYSLGQNNIALKRPRTVYSIIDRMFKSATVSFAGEPLNGLQIMGPLETRSLDFENVIFLSFNEGVFPSNGQQRSCIPYFLRKSFGLPTYENNDSISSYNFYRLVQRARRVFFIYDTNTEATKVKEESRFVKQLRYAYKVPLNEHEVKIPAKREMAGAPRPVALDAEIAANAADVYFSASLLNKYIDCPMLYYFSETMQFAQTEEIEDKIDASLFGTIYHFCMQRIYDQYAEEGRLFDGSALENMINALFPRGAASQKIKDVVDLAFKESFSIKYIEGENLIIKELIIKYIHHTLKCDYNRARTEPFRYVASEMKLLCSMQPGHFTNRFKAFLDRVEIVGNKLLICDYKSGNLRKLPQPESLAEDWEAVLEGLFARDGERSKEYSAMFQVILYAYIFRHEYRSGAIAWAGADISDGIEVGIYVLRKLKSQGLIRYNISNGQLDAFGERLGELMDEINSYKEGEHIRMNLNSAKCSFCDFRNYCLRK